MRTHTLGFGRLGFGRLAVAAVATGLMLVAITRLDAQEPRGAVKPAAEADAKKPEKPSERPDAGPRYKWLTADEAVRSKIRSYVYRWLKNFPKSKESIANFDNYYKLYAFMRLVDKKHLENITEVRREFRRDMRDAKPEAFEHLNNLAVRVLPSIIRNPRFHPVSRYNATLILGDLDLKKARGGKAAIPLPKALPVLVGDILTNPRQIDAVRVAAMIGIKRHASTMREFNVAALAAGRGLTIRSMLTLLTTVKAPAGRTPDGHAWMRRQACEVLGELGEVGPGGSIAKALVVVAAEKDSPLWLRCAAAHSLGRLKLNAENAADVKPSVVAKTLRDLAEDVCKAQLKRAASQRQPVSQEQLLADLGCIRAGLRGDPEGGLVALSSTSPIKPAVAKFVEKFETFYTSVENSPAGVGLNSKVADGLRTLLSSDKPRVPPIDGPPKAAPEVDPADKPVDPKPPGPKKPLDLDFGE